MEKSQLEEMVRVSAIRDIMENGWTAEEATDIYTEYRKRNVINILENGCWQYTSSAFTEKESQELALDLARNPPKQEWR
jgi:hypothetical protein